MSGAGHGNMQYSKGPQGTGTDQSKWIVLLQRGRERERVREGTSGGLSKDFFVLFQKDLREHRSQIQLNIVQIKINQEQRLSNRRTRIEKPIL